MMVINSGKVKLQKIAKFVLYLHIELTLITDYTFC
jgi:hypothetical protein